MNEVLITEVCVLKTGKTPPTNQEEYFNGNISWFTPGDLNKNKNLTLSNRTITDLAFQDKKAVVFEKGVLLMTCIGEIGKIGVTSEKCSSNQQITGLIPNEKVDVNYLYYSVKFQTPYLQNIANSAVVPILNNKVLGTLKIPLPNLETQKRIAAILDEADTLRQLNKQLIAKYDTLTQSLFLDMFGDPVTNSKGWDVKQLKDLTNLITDGKHGNCNDEDNSGYYFISAKDVRNNKINYTGVRQIPKSEFEEVDRRTHLQAGDLVMINTGATIGRMAIAEDIPKTRRTTFQKSVAVIKTKNEILISVFLQYVFELRLETFVTKGSGSAIKNLLLSEMKVFKIIVPPIHLQNQFAERVQLIEQQKQQAQDALQKSELLFNSLLQKAFNGTL